MRPGQTISSTKTERRTGGKGANQAAAVAQAGGPVSLVGAVGDDGTWILAGLQDIGVSVVGISTVKVRRDSMPFMFMFGVGVVYMAIRSS